MGVQLTNGAVPVGTRMVIRGNFECSNTASFATSVFASGPAVLNLDGSMPNYHPNQGTTFMEACNLHVLVEGDPDGATYQPTTILFTGSAAGSGANGIGGCWGGMYFDSGSLRREPRLQRQLLLIGPIIGDTNLNPADQNYHDNGRPVIAGGTPYLAVTGLSSNSSSQNRLIGGTSSGPPPPARSSPETCPATWPASTGSARRPERPAPGPRWCRSALSTPRRVCSRCRWTACRRRTSP